MTIDELNKILTQLAKNPSRENVLDFAFALLQWMNIEPNAENKPQLLSPQTQKLKDFLAPAPQTVQPQLYRLSADNQNVRVRFAVLKKLKKDYISQLVDNDPGLSSYQSFIKGITANGNGFVPTQPYFIHFVTTPDYDRLVLIFNQGEQKRIVSFRRRLTNTQYYRIIQQWQGVGSKPKPVIADLLWKSLDIKEVNIEFYRQVKERFDALLGIVKTQHTNATENQVKQFAVRLIGRYIFCWFLKEKGIIDHSLIGTKTIEETDNYYQYVLLKLFFETLNTKVHDRNSITHNKLFEKIPYLNGGLFDESEEDKLFTNFQLDAWLLSFVEILESYDFTVDESSSQYQQVAVDPEMLGRIFENLLASQNEETEKLANQRKAFGAFYTPREIVDYMVNESIKAYLQTQWEQHIIKQKSKTLNNPEPVGDIFGNKKPPQLAIETRCYELKAEEKTKIEKAIEPLFAAIPDAGHLKKEEKTLLLQFLEKIKILDPACGSGAFSMGILHKLVELHETLGTVKSPYELKNDILSQNIYGVDIMPMAIEIARLRAWLSLVLEENYNPKDSVHNFGVKPLPNLDFKFVCANSLIDLGLDAFIQESKGTLHEGFTKKLVTQLKELENLRKQFFISALGSSEKEQLKADYFAERDKVVTAIEADSDPVLKAIAQKIKHWNPFNDSQPSPFFSPTWMFGIDKGFDIVIGNPPYISTKGVDDKMKKELEKLYGFADDTYNHFYFKGIELLKDNGILAYISSKTFWTIQTKKNLRELLLKNKILQIFDTANPFENAMVDTCVVIVQKTQSEDNHTIIFLDGKNDLLNPDKYFIHLTSYKKCPNQVIFIPTDYNKKINERFGKKVNELLTKWWDKISTSKNIDKNKKELELYRKSLKPGDITLLGLITEGGQGLATANNGKYIGVLEGTKWADNVRKQRPEKLLLANKFCEKQGIHNKQQAQAYLESLSENEIRQLFDELKEEYGRDIFGQGWLYRIVSLDEIADVEKLKEDEKLNGIAGAKTFVPYDKGDKDGNRWYAPTPYYIDWSKENVKFLKENSGKKGEGMPVVRNPQFYFREGFCWTNVLNPNARLIKTRLKDKTINDVGTMSLTSVINNINNKFFVCILNSNLMFDFYRIFINYSVNIQINDIRQLPIIIPTPEQLKQFEDIFNRAYSIQKQRFSGQLNDKAADKKLESVQKELDKMVEEMYMG